MLKIIEIRTKRTAAVVGIKDGEIEVLECTNFRNCKIQGVVEGNLSDGCPHFCYIIVAAKKHAKGLKADTTIKILRRF